MKSFIITAAVSILAFNHIAMAQSPEATKKHEKIVATIMASLPTEDLDTEPKATVWSAKDKMVLALMPTVDLNTEAPAAPAMEVAAAEVDNHKNNKVEEKSTVEIKKVADR